jgi:hypothetical protein
VLGLEVVLADGRVINGLNKLKKDNTGYDLRKSFIGAEGTLGIITAAVLKMFPRPRRSRPRSSACPRRSAPRPAQSRAGAFGGHGDEFRIAGAHRAGMTVSTAPMSAIRSPRTTGTC